jgi:hypothetical protein
MDLRCLRCGAELHTHDYAELTAWAAKHAGDCKKEKEKADN